MERNEGGEVVRRIERKEGERQSRTTEGIVGGNLLK
jgi:hypothetical protein